MSVPGSPFSSTVDNPVRQIAVLVVDYLVATGVLKDAEALRAEGAKRERQRIKKQQAKKKRKKKPVKKSKRKRAK